MYKKRNAWKKFHLLKVSYSSLTINIFVIFHLAVINACRVFNTWINQILYPFPSIAWRADIFQILIKSALRNSHREVVAARSRIRPRQYYITSVRLFRRPLRRRRTDGKRGKPSKIFVSSLLSYLLTLPTWNS